MSRKTPLLSASSGFAEWLSEVDVTVALTTYQTGRLFFIGRRPDGSLRAHERAVGPCQGLATDGSSLWFGADWALWRFGAEPDDRNGLRRFAPREARITGRLDIHDIALRPSGGPPLFVATRYGCIATVSDTASFRPIWRPPFLSALVAEDRCHLNGLALDRDRPAYVTAVSRSDVADGWRDRRRDGGVVVDVPSGEIVVAGLSMPHSPRLVDGRLWLLNSGTGEFGVVEPNEGAFTPVTFVPGFARGLAIVDRFAVIGLSKSRRGGVFEGLALQERLHERDTVARCGLIVVDLVSGRTVEFLRFERSVEEMYDVAVLPGVREAEATGFVGNDIAERITVGAGNGDL